LPRGTRLSVEPRYLLQVEDDHVLLEALLRYTVRGAKVSFVEVDLPGWDVESVEPEGRVLSEALSWTQVEPFVVRLAQPASGQFDLTLRARRRIDPSATALSLPLPQVRAARVSPAAIAVLSADNVELTPADDQAPELTPDTSPPAWELPARQQDPLYFQASGQESPLSFRCGFAVHQQAVSVDVHTEIRFEDRRAAVEQAFSYRVAHQPLHQLLLQADPSITRSGNLELTLDGQPLTAQPLRDESGAATEPQSVPLRVNLPAARIGACRLVVRYQTPLETVGDDGPNQAIVPLVMPEQGQLQQNTLAVLNGRSMDIELPDPSLWQPDAQAADEASSAGAVGFSSQQGTTRFELIASFPSASAEEPLRIDKTWIQCWLTHSARVDRATFRFSTGHDHVRISLPENVARDRCEFVLDGKRAAPVETNGQPLRVDLPLADRDRDHVLEVICRFEERPRPGRLQVQLPRLEGAQWTSHTYWELVLPIDEHLLFGPEEMNCEQRWQRSAWRVQRRPTLSQRQLEHWMGASRQAPPSSGVNRYLFSALTSPPQLASYSIRRQFAVLVFSGTALIVGLLVIYVPVVRHPVGLLVFGVLVLVVGLQQPVPAILIAQAALFGLALAIGAYLLRSALMRRRFRRAVIHGMAAPVAEDRGDIDSHASTRTGPTPLPPPEPDPSE